MLIELRYGPGDGAFVKWPDNEGFIRYQATPLKAQSIYQITYDLNTDQHYALFRGYVDPIPKKKKKRKKKL